VQSAQTLSAQQGKDISLILASPFIPASDACGTVAALCLGVTRFTKGDRVIPVFTQGWIGGVPTPDMRENRRLGVSLDGVLREFIAVRAEDAVHAPANLSDVEVATLPIAAVTAWATLREGGVKTGDGVLAMGTGGVAIFTLQFAKLAGAQVVVISSSDDKLARVRKLGADATISYRTNPDWAPLVRQATNGRGVNISRCGCRSAEFLSNVICITRTQAGGEYGRPVPLPTLPRLAARFPKGAAGAPFPHFGHAQSIRESPRDSKSPSRPCRTRSRATRPGGGGAVRHGRQL
jgi:threonine dehydrogenase-like Zn-dependent dehydrogenase